MDLASDPDAPALRRPDGTLVARFGVGGMTYEVLEREAFTDLLRTNQDPPGGKARPRGNPSDAKT